MTLKAGGTTRRNRYIELHQNQSFCVSFISLSMLFSKLIHDAACNRTSFLLKMAE